MMGVDSIVASILSQGGVWAALFLLAASASVYLYKDRWAAEARCTAASDEKAKALEALHEKRHGESATLIQVVERNNASGSARAAALESLNASTAKLAEGFAVLAQAMDSRGERCREQLDRMERRLEVLVTMLTESERRQEAVLARLPTVVTPRGRS